MTEFIVFVLLAGLAVAEPATDHSDAVLALAPPTADVFVYADAEALVQPAWRFVRHELPRQPFVANVPELTRELERGFAEIDDGLEDMKSALGLDPTKDLHRAALWLEIRQVRNNKPTEIGLLVALWGNFPADGLARLASTAGWSSNTAPNGPTVYEVDRGDKLFAVQLDTSTILFGTEDLIAAPRTAPAAPTKGTPRDLHKQRLAAGAIALLAIDPGKPLQELTRGVTASSTSARDMLGSIESLTLAFYADGLDLDLTATSRDMAERYQMFTLGLIDLVEGGRSATRGLARTLLSAMTPGDPELDSKLAPLLQNSDAILGLIDGLTGTGPLTVTDRTSLGDKRVAVELRAGHVREIILPLALAIGTLTLM